MNIYSELKTLSKKLYRLIMLVATSSGAYIPFDMHKSGFFEKEDLNVSGKISITALILFLSFVI